MAEKEYIEREAVMLQINIADFVRDDNYEAGATLLFQDDVVDRISSIPAADVRPVVRGFNVRKAYPSLFECSQCGWGCDDTYYCDTPTFKFCPNCGAMMEES